jgi:hypothetical protein
LGPTCWKWPCLLTYLLAAPMSLDLPACWQWPCLLAYLLVVGVSPCPPADSGRVPWPTCWQWACPLAYLLAVGVSPGLPAGSGRVPYVGEASVPVPAHPGGVEAVHHLVGCTKRSRHFRSLSLPQTIICFSHTLHKTQTVVSPFPLYWQERWQTTAI